jgi:preprotein translocase subunit SecG
MAVLMSVSTILFFILCLLLIVIILLQSDKSAGMGILGGSSQSTFGSSTADVITKITTVMVALFMLGSLGLAMMESYKNKAIEKELLSSDSKATGAIEQQQLPPKDQGNQDKKDLPAKK